MSTVREGNRPVLVVVDVQVGVLREAWDAARVIANVARAVERARAQDVPSCGCSMYRTSCRRAARDLAALREPLEVGTRRVAQVWAAHPLRAVA